LRQFARVRQQVPNALSGGEDDRGRTDFHTTVSLDNMAVTARDSIPSKKK
jgi:hypothetical protein